LRVADFYEKIASVDPILAATWVADTLLGELNYRDMSMYRGRANPGLQMKSMMFAFRLQNPQDLERLLLDQQDPKSPNYHRWLDQSLVIDKFIHLTGLDLAVQH
jgi:aspartyl-tRNA(Asn)/glutamyl-tRNA(Gln) amidotransferase subunit B